MSQSISLIKENAPALKALDVAVCGWLTIRRFDSNSDKQHAASALDFISILKERNERLEIMLERLGMEIPK